MTHTLPRPLAELSQIHQLHEGFAHLAKRHPQQLALRFESGLGSAAQDWSYEQLWQAVGHCSAKVQAMGLVKGQRLAWLGLNHPMMLVTLLVCSRLGLVFTPLNFRLAAAELQTILDDAQASVLVYDSHHAQLAQPLHVPHGQVYSLDHLFDQLFNQFLDMPATQTPTQSVQDTDQTSSAHQCANHTPLLLVYTSGTTGKPKGAVHSQAGVLANARASVAAHGFIARDHVLSTLPMFHVGGLCIQTLPALLAGVPVTLHARFDPGAWLASVASGVPSLSLLVPATMRAVLEHPQFVNDSNAALGNLRGVMAGSSVIPVSYIRTFHARGVPVGQIYGATETGPVSVVLRLQDAKQYEGAVGWPAVGAQLQLRDTSTGQCVSTGQVGELWVQAPNVMLGYWQGLDAHGQAITGAGLQDSWFCTGDLASMDEQACVTVVGRSKDMLISGGENIYPAEIENLLLCIPGVADCAVVAMQDERWGEVPWAVVVPHNNDQGQALTVEGVLQALVGQIAKFKLPRKVVFMQALPKNAMGKVVKAELCALLAAK